MNKYKSIFATAIFLLVSCSIVAQINEKFKTAEDLLNKYLIASKFEENGQFQINENTRNSFTELFRKDARIIFDVPLSSDASIKSNTKKYGNQERYQSPVISIFGKEVSPEMYVATLEKEIKGQIAIITLPTGRKDISGIDSSGLVVFEIEKSFQEQDSLTNSVKYLLEIDVSGHKPLITGIRPNKENILKRNVLIQLFNDSRAVTKVNTFTCVITIEFPESINNTIDTVQSFDGKIRLEQIANRATLKIIRAHDQEAIDYEIPLEWKGKGKKVSEQPEDGFEVNLLPRLWKGWSYIIDIRGGVFQQGQNNTANFKEGNFINDPGYRFGGEFLVTKYFNPKKWKQSNWLFGIGIGATLSYQWAITRSDSFIQKPYKYKDTSGDPCKIQFSSEGFKETTTRIDIAIPVYIDFRLRLSGRASMTIQPGVNLILPIQISQTAEGNFSRWGYYEFNDLPYTEDPVYNYFTNQAKTYADEGLYAFQMEGQLRLNFLLNVFDKHPDNALVIGLTGSLPIINPTYTYSQGIVQEYQGYWISTENDDFHSLEYSKAQPYNFFIGLSVGINLVKFKTKQN